MTRRDRISADYDHNVFINCPFDDEYQPLFNAIVFTVFECGVTPRCAKEVYDGGEVRIEKIVRLIRDCRWGVHDISRTTLNANNLPRFNMPLELGLFLGAQRFGSGRQTDKSCVVMDREPWRFREFMSDIAGQDIAPHDDSPQKAVKAVRDWLAASGAGPSHPPGASAIIRRYERFMADLPAICRATDRDPAELTFTEFTDAVSTWLKLALSSE